MTTVTVSPSGKSFPVERGESLLEAALRAGLSLPFGCRNGACRSCEGQLLAGRVRYPGGGPKALAPAEVASGRVLLCTAEAAADVHVRIDEVDPDGQIQVRTLPCRIAAKERLAHDVVRLMLALPAGERLRFRAGQYVDLLLRDGRRRAFSLANPPHEDRLLELHVRQVPGGSFSGKVLEGLRERALMRLTGPLGSFYLRDEACPVILVAGGTGFAPVKSIVEDVLRRGLTRPIAVYWGARARRDLYLNAVAGGWSRLHPEFRYVPVLSEPAEADEWDGRTGLVHEAVLADFDDLSQHALYLSGPPAMVRAARRDFAARGAVLDRMHSDAFDYAYETGHDG